MSYLGNACTVKTMDGESKESVYNNFGMSNKGKGGISMVVAAGATGRHPLNREDRVY